MVSGNSFAQVNIICVDAELKAIEGVTLRITQGKTFYTDLEGSARLDNINSLFCIQLQKLGYAAKDTCINAQDGDTILIQLVLQSYFLEEVTMQSSRINPQSIQLNKRDFQKIAGSFDDPTRLMSKAAGTVTTNDQNNAFSYRGLPTSMLKWQLFGTDVLNPNHLSNAGTVFDSYSPNAGGVNMISAELLKKFSYYTPSSLHNNYNTLGGTADIALVDSLPAYVKFSLLGLEAGTGLNFSSKTKAVINYRYSFTGLLNKLGIDFNGERIGYQDGAVIINHEFTNTQKLRLYHLEGRDRNLNQSDSLNTIDWSSGTRISGINYQNTKQGIVASLTFSNKRISREETNEKPFSPNFDVNYTMYSMTLGKQWNANRKLLLNQRIESHNKLYATSVSYLDKYRLGEKLYLGIANVINSYSGEDISKNSSLTYSPKAALTYTIGSQQNITTSLGVNDYLENMYSNNRSRIPKVHQLVHAEVSHSLSYNNLVVSNSGFFYTMPNDPFGGLAMSPDLEAFKYSGGYVSAVEYSSTNGIWINGSATWIRYVKGFEAEINSLQAQNSYVINMISGKTINRKKGTLTLSLGGSWQNGQDQRYMDNLRNTTILTFNKVTNFRKKQYIRLDGKITYSSRKWLLSLDIQNLSNYKNTGLIKYALDAQNNYAGYLQDQLGVLPNLTVRRTL